MPRPAASPVVLVTAFEPFGGETVNPSALLIAHESVRNGARAAGLDLKTVVLPVTFADAFAALKSQIDAFDPDCVLSIGQAGARASLQLERVAINCLDAEIPDNKGAKPRDLRITAGGREAYFATLPIRRLQEAAVAAGVAAEISNSAGTYVCNYLMYRLLEETRWSRRRCGFLHVPFLPEQAAAKLGRASLALDEMAKGLAAMLAAVRGQTS